jgi:hypothetical protein
MKRILLLTAVALSAIAVSTHRDALARPPAGSIRITHTYEDEEIEPIGELKHNGRSVVLTMGGPLVAHPNGTQINVTVVVFQEEIGAYGVGHEKGMAGAPDGPETTTFPRTAHALGNISFEEGPATACYFAEERRNGQVVREWFRCADVDLLNVDE